MKRWVSTVVLAALAVGCRGERPGSISDAALTALIDSLIPEVERAVGFEFNAPPRYAARSKEAVRAFLLAKLDTEFPDAKIRGVESAYQLLGLLPDSVDTRTLLLGLYSEQVAGYYDPDSTTLYVVEGATGDQLTLVLAHELVHALQHQRLPLERLLGGEDDADRQAASQAVLEGHATIAMLGIMMPDQTVLRDPQFWQLYRDQVRNAQTSMPVFASAPLVLREGLIFPYLGGAEFMRWWNMQGGPDPLPRAEDLPRSTEHILHPDRYRDGDAPVVVEFVEPAPSLLHEDTLGELELLVWRTEMRGGGEVLSDLAIGWGGDRFRVYPTPDGPALVLYTVWDDSVSARRFKAGPATRFVERGRSGYRTAVDAMTIDGRPVVRVVRAPSGWKRWVDLPTVRLPPAQ